MVLVFCPEDIFDNNALVSGPSLHNLKLPRLIASCRLYRLYRPREFHQVATTIKLVARFHL